MGLFRSACVRWWLALCLVACAGGPIALAAQTLQTGGGPGEDAPAKAESETLMLPALDAASLVERADTDERVAESAIRRASEVSDRSPALSAALEDIARSVDARIDAFPYSRLRTLPIMRLESLSRHWSFDRRRFDRWRDEMLSARAPYMDDASTLAKRRSEWAALLERQQDLPPALLQRIQQVVAKLDMAQAVLSGALQRQIALGQRANAVQTRLADGQRMVDNAIDGIDKRLLHLDSPPLWRASLAAGEASRTTEVLASSLQIEADFATAYAESNTTKQGVMHLIQLLLLPCLLWLSWRSRQAVAAGHVSPAAKRVVRRPLSAWLLLGMAATLAFMPDAPLLTCELAMLAALVPVLRLLPPGSARVLDVWPYVATALYVAAGLGAIFMGSALIYRWYTLCLAVLGMAMMLWLLLRSKRRAGDVEISRAVKALRAVAWGAVGVFALSVVCGVVGNTSLAEMLTSAVIDSAYFGLLLYVAVNVLTTLLQLLFGRSGPSRFKLTRGDAPPLVMWLFRLIVAIALVGWCVYAMQSFRVLRPLYAAVSSLLRYQFSVGDFTLSLGNIGLFLLAALLAFGAARATRVALREVVDTRLRLDRGMSNSVASLGYYAVMLLGLLAALSVAGFQTSQLALVFGALGVGIGFGLQNVVNNFVSGLILMFERPVRPGDVIELGGTAGRVRNIGLRATRIRTFEGADVVVPNGSLLAENLTNWTLLDSSRRLEVPVGVAYGTDPNKVLELLTQAAKSAPGITASPPTVVLFSGFGDSSLDFLVRAWTQEYERWPQIRSGLVSRIYAALENGGIEIPFPQRVLHVRDWPQIQTLALNAEAADDTGSESPQAP